MNTFQQPTAVCRSAFCLTVETRAWPVSLIPYTTVKFPKDAAASAKVRDANHGNGMSQTVEVGHRYLFNPSLNDIRQALHDDRDAS